MKPQHKYYVHGQEAIPQSCCGGHICYLKPSRYWSKAVAWANAAPHITYYLGLLCFKRAAKLVPTIKFALCMTVRRSYNKNPYQTDISPGVDGRSSEGGYLTLQAVKTTGWFLTSHQTKMSLFLERKTKITSQLLPLPTSKVIQISTLPTNRKKENPNFFLLIFAFRKITNSFVNNTILNLTWLPRTFLYIIYRLLLWAWSTRKFCALAEGETKERPLLLIFCQPTM